MLVTQGWNLDPRQFWLHGKRPEHPVEFDEDTGLWNVYGYPEIHHILSDPKTFSSDTGRIIPEENQFAEGNLLQMDPPEHTKLRKLISHAFTPKVVADLEPRIHALANELIDAVADQDRMELVNDLAYPLPVIVIAELLGVPSSDRYLFKEWVDTMFTATQGFSLKDQSEEQLRGREIAMEQFGKLSEYLTEHAKERRTAPREDLLTKLVEAEVDGERLSLDEVVNFANVLLIAGHITTTMLLGNTVLCLDAHPDAFAKIRADRSMVPAAIEESLRFLSPFAALGRITEHDTEIGGRTIGTEQVMMLWIAAANRDPRQFPEPDIYDPSREPNQQIAFGRGVHFCVGAPLARLEGRVALNVLLDRFPQLRSDPEQQPVFLQVPTMTGVNKLPMLLN